MLKKHQHESNMRDDLVPEKENSQKTMTMLERIGSTVYEVSIHFSENQTEPLEDKVLRLIEREVDKIA